MQAVWYEGHFRRRIWSPRDGHPLVIRSPGRWNGGPGPDFLRAELVLEGRDVKGDVELHLRASDWRAHGHAEDPEYRGVVLHVVLDIDDALPRDTTPSGRDIPRLELRPLLHGDFESLGVRRLARGSALRLARDGGTLPAGAGAASTAIPR